MTTFQSAWKSNRGNLLLLIAAVASVVVSGIWYFDLLPNIKFVSAELPMNAAAPVANPPTVLVVTVVVPEFTDAGPISGYVRVHSPFGSLPEMLDSIAVREFQVREQRIIPVVFTELAAGNYAISAFLDFNDNGILDMTEQRVPSEPVRLSNGKDLGSALDLEMASVFLGRGHTLNIRLNFDN